MGIPKKEKNENSETPGVIETPEVPENINNKLEMSNMIDKLAAAMDRESIKFHVRIGIVRDNSLYDLLKSYIKRLGDLGEEAKKRNI